MKFIQITDPHLVTPGELLHGLNPYDRLSRCIDDINQHHGDAELCVITGDLAHLGSIEAYMGLKECLSHLDIPFSLLIGNHDKRHMMKKVFPDQSTDSNNFFQGSRNMRVGTFLFLDTVEESKDWGSYCDLRLAWLNQSLKNCLHTSVYIFMHHPPFNVQIPCLDRIGLGNDGNKIGNLFTQYGNIRHIFFGHVHRPVSGSWLGIPYSTLRGTSHQTPLDFEAIDVVPKSHEPPAYAIVFLTEDQTTVHFHDYLDKSRIVYNKKTDGKTK